MQQYFDILTLCTLKVSWHQFCRPYVLLIPTQVTTLPSESSLLSIGTVLFQTRHCRTLSEPKQSSSGYKPHHSRMLY